MSTAQYLKPFCILKPFCMLTGYNVFLYKVTECVLCIDTHCRHTLHSEPLCIDTHCVYSATLRALVYIHTHRALVYRHTLRALCVCLCTHKKVCVYTQGHNVCLYKVTECVLCIDTHCRHTLHSEPLCIDTLCLLCLHTHCRHTL